MFEVLVSFKYNGRIMYDQEVSIDLDLCQIFTAQSLIEAVSVMSHYPVDGIEIIHIEWAGSGWPWVIDTSLGAFGAWGENYCFPCGGRRYDLEGLFATGRVQKYIEAVKAGVDPGVIERYAFLVSRFPDDLIGEINEHFIGYYTHKDVFINGPLKDYALIPQEMENFVDWEGLWEAVAKDQGIGGEPPYIFRLPNQASEL